MPEQPDCLLDERTGCVREKRMVDAAHVDFSKASVTVSHCILVAKFMSYGLDKWTIKWEKNWLDCWS